jgi:hypothetical protein
LRVQNANSPFAFDTSAPGLPPVYTYTIYFNISIYERERESESKSERAREGGNEGRREGGRGVRAQDHFSNLALGSSATWPSRAALAVGNCFAVSI